MRSRLNLVLVLTVSLFSLSWLFYTYRHHDLLALDALNPFQKAPDADDHVEVPGAGDKIVVVANIDDDVSWISNDLPGWQSAIYQMNGSDPEQPLQVPANKGRESMAYLTYIIDHYSDLPSTILFLHPHKDGYPKAWHNDAPKYSNVHSVRTLRLNYVQRHGYANMRCQHNPGCPDEIQLLRNDDLEEHAAERAMRDAWIFMFGNDLTVPDVIAAPCCGQFAVSRDQVLKRELKDYVKYREWLLSTELNDYTSGRVFEYLWHVIFGQDPIYCPTTKQCYCEQFGRCSRQG